MSSAKTHMTDIVTAVEALGYVFTDEFFDFETVPASGDDEVYRLECKTAALGGMSGNRVEKTQEFTIWVAFKLAVASNRKQDFYDVLDAKEDLEDDVLQAPTDIQVTIVENIISPVISDYLIVKLTGQFLYWRDLT
ncbi:MAG: hypothetical protein GY940_07400 [bacterium]|nr:hypothetical protein [bacterium]